MWKCRKKPRKPSADQYAPLVARAMGGAERVLFSGAYVGEIRSGGDWFMVGGRKLRRFALRSALFFLLVGFQVPSSARAQGFVTTMPSRARVFAEIGSGVVVMKRDAADRYFVLATPRNVIWIYNANGKRVGQIPATGPEKGVAVKSDIGYAVDFDFDPSGRILVADRAANAVEIFSPEGVLIKKIAVFAPTGVVALPENQFAVSTLRPEYLVEIRSEQGALIRIFGDPAQAGADPDAKQLQDFGKVSGDGTGNIYYSFATLADPTVRKYDRFGYVNSEATLTADLYAAASAPAPSPDDRVQFGFNFSSMNLVDSYNSWVTIGNKGDVLFGGGLSPGLRTRLGGFGGGPVSAESASENLLAAESPTGLGGGYGRGGFRGGGGFGGDDVSAQGSFPKNSLRVHFDSKLVRPPGTGGATPGWPAAGATNSSGTASTSANNSTGAYIAPNNLIGPPNSIAPSVLLFDAPDPAAASGTGAVRTDSATEGTLSFSSSGTNAETGSTDDDLSTDSLAATDGAGGLTGPGAGMAFAAGLSNFGQPGGIFLPGALAGGGLFGHGFPRGTESPFGGGGFGPRFGDARSEAAGPFQGFAEHAGGMPFPHGHFGQGLNNVTATVKVNLDHKSVDPNEKLAITAVGIDPVSQDIWEGLGKVLVHFDKNGGYMGTYFIATPDGAPLRASAIVVELDRLIIASETQGIYEFARPDARVSRAPAQPASAAQAAPPAPVAQ
jgi:hypothetical protein